VTEVRNFMELLKAKWAERKFVCVGLDSDPGKLPILHLGIRRANDDDLIEAQEAYREAQKTHKPLMPWHIQLLADAMMSFNEFIIDATYDLICAYKPNSAFYEPLGSAGISVLHNTLSYITRAAPDVPRILDYKRGDIGNTNQGYVRAAALADAVTVHPYLGMEAMKPFLEQKDMGAIVLCRTSNPGAGEFQDLRVHQGVHHDDSGEAIYGPLYQRVARRVSGAWNYNGNCAVVAGATYPSELAQIRQIVGNMPILIPGIGSQGGDLEATVRAGADSNKQGMIINNSRGIIFASDGPDFAEAARAKLLKMHEDINIVLESI
jgi:orotidine-5'-phosphate decarboxylase